MSIGYLPREAEAMENLMIDMDGHCEKGVDDDVELRSRYAGMPLLWADRNMVVPYHETMLPLWKRFSEAVINADDGLEELDIVGVSMDIHVSRLLSDSIMNNHPHLTMVRLNRCGMSNTSILRTLLDGCSRMKNIDLGYNEITSEGARVIADFIENNNPVHMQAISLAKNNISDGDTNMFASALKSSDYFFLLDLIDNNITELGWKVIMSSVFDLTSMNALVDCNHTCMIWKVGDDEDEEEILSHVDIELIMINADLNEDGETRSIQTPIKKKIRKKVVLALCGVDGQLFDLSLLNDVPLQLMPRVLELIQEHTAIRQDHCNYDDEQLEKEALLRLFYTLRAWHLPLLFDNLHGVPTRRSKRKRGGSSR